MSLAGPIKRWPSGLLALRRMQCVGKVCQSVIGARQTITVITFRKSSNNSLALTGQVGEKSTLYFSVSWNIGRHILPTVPVTVSSVFHDAVMSTTPCTNPMWVFLKEHDFSIRPHPEPKREMCTFTDNSGTAFGGGCTHGTT